MIDVKREETEKKLISEMTEKAILRQQLELLAEHSITCDSSEIASITIVMVSLCELLEKIS